MLVSEFNLEEFLALIRKAFPDLEVSIYKEVDPDTGKERLFFIACGTIAVLIDAGFF